MLFANGVYTVLHALLGFLITVALMRYYLHKLKASVHNPLGRFIIAVSNPVIVPLRRIIPGWKGQDLSSLVVAFAIGSVLAVVEVQLLFRGTPSGLALMWIGLVGGVYNAILLSVHLFIWLLIAYVILSWVNPAHWAYYLTGQLTEFLRLPIARLLPPLGGIDLSVLVLFLVLRYLVLGALERGWVLFLAQLLQ